MSNEQMLQTVKEKMELAYSVAVENGIADPVIFVLSLRDDNGRWVAEHFAGKDKVAEGVKEAGARGTDLTLTVSAPREKADRIIEKLAPELGERLRGQFVSEGQYLALAFGDGRITSRLQQVP